MNEGEDKKRKICENGVTIEGGAFYNPAQMFNRALTIKIINQFIQEGQRPGVVLLECMSATGLRGIRYVKEISGENTIVMNDISERACESIVSNCLQNGVPAELNRVVSSGRSSVEVRNEDCRVLMLSRKRAFDVIDVDPFGTCAPYIETAIEGLAENGLLCVTSTDSKVLCDKPPESCYKYYGSVSMNNSHAHETAVRIVLSYISRTAAKLGRRITPLVSLSMDFFIRVFVQVSYDKKGSTETLLKNQNYFICACMNKKEQPILQKEPNREVYKHVKAPASTTCRMCQRTFSMYGPIWSGPLHSRKFLDGVIAGIDRADISSKTGGVKETAYTEPQINRRIHGMLSMARDELDSVFYYSIPTVASILSFPVPPFPMLISFLHANGLAVSLTHCKPNAIKVDGAVEYVYLSVILYYKNIRPSVYAVYEDRLQGRRADVEKNTHNLMVYLEEFAQKNSVQEVFEVDEKASELTSKKYLKFQDKSGLGWGPMKR
ncbi:tRNA (guanine26-N2/guanine27-N2)-dimethyltransferase [Nematocida major]|uniref:tRNA (guanine26-N2/guanine27-N2)-dimethyltransferase n=1 Tax=Nematocida major TaxID=1912982 RepID=UPI0020077D78|nr:tRNA (guanine26-N2/guanine27-N2)-dimethyltransferase [Nematocida major]KAH9386595.1 tRNA (guanine26-N2/guanine27-N2)-dimethyltransferase [Nematocida major]